MRLADQVRSVRHTFATNRGRVALTLLGIIIGAGSIVLLASLLTAGEEALVATDQEATEANVVRVDSAPAGGRDALRPQRELSERDAQLLGDTPALPGARVTGERVRLTKARRGKEHKRIVLVASEPISSTLYKLDVTQGRFLSDDDLLDGRRVCVVGVNVWKELFAGARSLENATLEADGVIWNVVGVLANKSTLGGGGAGPWMWNNKVIVPRTTFDATFFGGRAVDQIYVRVQPPRSLPHPTAQLANVRGIIRATLLRRHLGVENFKVDRDAKTVAQLRMIRLTIKILLLGTGLLALLVGGINVMNIMLVTVTERTREIGIRRAVGAGPASIILQFLLESTALALAGGCIGVLGGIALAALVAPLLHNLLGTWHLRIEGWSVGLGLGLSLLTGIAFGLFPAWKASRLDPVEALRTD